MIQVKAMILWIRRRRRSGVVPLLEGAVLEAYIRRAQPRLSVTVCQGGLIQLLQALPLLLICCMLGVLGCCGCSCTFCIRPWVCCVVVWSGVVWFPLLVPMFVAL